MFCGSGVNSTCDLDRVIVGSDLTDKLNCDGRVGKGCVMSGKVVSEVRA